MNLINNITMCFAKPDNFVVGWLLSDLGRTIKNGVKNVFTWIFDTIFGFLDLGRNIMKFLATINLAAMDAVSDMVTSCTLSYTGMFGLIRTLYAICVFFSGATMLVLVIYKCAENLIGISSGGEYTPVGLILWRTIKSSAFVMILPALMLLAANFIPVLAESLIHSSFTETYTIGGIETNVKSNGGYFSLGNLVVINLLTIFVIIVLIVYFFKACKYQVDLVLLELVSPFAAVSNVTDEKEFYLVWKRTAISIFFSMAMNLVCFSIVVSNMKAMFDYGIITASSAGSLVLVVGAGICMIKEPEIIKAYKYSSGAGNAAKRGAGAVARAGLRIASKGLL